MALSQLITTVDIANSNVGINNSVASGTNSIALGNGQNVGIGIDAPLAGLHIGNSGSTVPVVYLSDATSASLPAIGANDGIFSVVAGIPTFTNANAASTLFSLSSEAVGVDTLIAGTVVVTSSIVTTSSIILITRTSTTGDVTTMGTLSAIAGTGSFTVNSTVITDVSSFNYLVINA